MNKSTPYRYPWRLLGLCLATGCASGIWIYGFRYLAHTVSHWSHQLYLAAQSSPIWLPVLALGCALLGVIAGFFWKHVPECRGGGIPTAIATLRGLAPIRWAKTALTLFPAALITYLGGVPLGTEGPSVQMGTAIGRGAMRCFGRSTPAWDRYVMTGGACAGFAAATGAPVTGIFFAFEEAHRRLTPLIFTATSLTVLAATITSQLLHGWMGTSPALIHLGPLPTMPLSQAWIAPVIGGLCGLVAALFNRCFARVRHWVQEHPSRLHPRSTIVVAFLLTGLCGWFYTDFTGSGLELTQKLLTDQPLWLLLVLFFAVRGALLMLSNNAGVTGGLFVPTLAFGALLGSLCTRLAIALGWLPGEMSALGVILGMVCFLGASSHIPFSAILFSVEVLGCYGNILPVALAVCAAHLVMHHLGGEDLTEVVVEGKVRSQTNGRSLQAVEAKLRVCENSFADGKEIRDIFWPPSCTVVAIYKNGVRQHRSLLCAGDSLQVIYQTYDKAQTHQLLEELVGSQG